MVGQEKDEAYRRLPNEHLDVFRNYVTCRDDQAFDQVPDGFVKLDVSHSNLEQRWHRITFVLSDTVTAAKEKLHKHGGSAVNDMELYLRRGPGDTVLMGDERLTLAFYGAKHGMEIFVKDTNPFSISAGGALENVDLVEKYEMCDEDYDKLEKSVRAEKRRRAAAKAAELAANPPPPREATPDDKKEQWLKQYGVGARCQCKPGDRRGVVRYFGELPKTEGSFVGVELDEPMGKNDGKHPSGKQIFVCEKGDKYGMFVRPDNVEVGDFPERDPFDELSDDEI